MSSSGHLALADARASKEFAVALHAGSAPALLLAARRELFHAPGLLALTVAPAALAGLAGERAVDERLGRHAQRGLGPAARGRGAAGGRPPSG